VINVLFILVIFACVVLHELGHSVVALRYGIPVSSITLYPIGGVAAIEKQPKPKQEFWIALAGPAVNVAIAVVVTGVFAVSRQNVFPSLWQLGQTGSMGFWQDVLRLNLFLVIFNLIPAFPMDGGRVLRAVLAMKMAPAAATAIAAQVGQGIAVLAGFWAIFSHPPNLWLALIAFFIYIGAGQEAGAYRQAAVLEGVQVRDAMITDVRTLSVGNTLKEAADVLLDTSQHDFPVLHADTVQGLLTRNDLLRGLSEQGPGSFVAGVMRRQFVAARPEAKLAEMLPGLQTTPGPLLVMEGDRLLGIVTADNIQELFAIRQIGARQGESRRDL
jgi:Zn-dependent protease/CBS domain-containing protein